MSFDVTKRLNQEDVGDKLEFYGCHLVLSTCEELFAYVSPIDDDTLILKDAVSVVKRRTKDGFGLEFTKFSPYSNDAFCLVQRHHVVAINDLSEDYRKAYDDVFESASATNDMEDFDSKPQKELTVVGGSKLVN